MIKGVIFDLDGVICSTDEFHYLAWKKLADREGIYFDRTINNRLRGVSRMASLDIVLERSSKSYSDEQKLEMATFKNNIYREYLMQMTPKDLSDDVLFTLKTLKEKGIKISIGSSSKNTKLILTNIGIIDMFDTIVDGNDIKNSKPDPEVFIKARESLKLEKDECYVVEDAYAGIDAANASGVKSIGIGDASKYDKASFKIQKLSDILKLI